MQEPMYRVEANDGTSTWRPYGDGKPLEIEVAQKRFEEAKEFYGRMGFPLSELRISPVTGPNAPQHSIGRIYFTPEEVEAARDALG